MDGDGWSSAMERRGEDPPHLDGGGEVDAWPTVTFAEFSLSVLTPNMVAGMDGWMDGWYGWMREASRC